MKPYYLQAKVMSKGQITIPVEIRKHLDLKPGDYVTFIISQEGLVRLTPSFVNGLEKLQEAMKGEAEKAGLYTEEDVVNLIKEMRREKNH